MTCEHEPADVVIPVVMSDMVDAVQQVAITIPSPTHFIPDRRLPVALCLKCGVLYLPEEELAKVRDWVKLAYDEAIRRSKQAAEWEAKKAKKT